MTGRELAFGAVLASATAACDAGPRMASTASMPQGVFPDTSPLHVTLRDDGAMLIDGEVVDADTVRRRAGSRTVFIIGSGAITYAQFTSALKQLEGLNIPTLVVGSEGPPQ